MDDIGQFIESVLSNFPADLGEVVTIHQTGELPFIVLFHDIPWNWGVRLSTAKALDFFLRSKTIELVGVEGESKKNITSEALDLTYQLSSEVMEKEIVALYFLKQLKLTGADYCLIFYPIKKIPFLLYGVEDRKSYHKMVKLWKSHNFSRFFELEERHGVLMLDNLLNKMKEMEEEVSILICCGNFPDIICQEMERRGISYARIEPKSSVPDNRELFEEVLRGKKSALEKVFKTSKFKTSKFKTGPLIFLSRYIGLSIWRQSDGNCEDYQIQQIRERQERQLRRTIKLQTEGDKIEEIEIPSAFRKLQPSENLNILEIFYSLYVPSSEWKKFPQPEIHYVALEALLSGPEFEKLPGFENNIANYLERVPRADIDKLLQSSTISSNIKSEFIRQRMPSFIPEQRVPSKIQHIVLETLTQYYEEYFLSDNEEELLEPVERIVKMLKKSDYERHVLSSVDTTSEVKSKIKRQIVLSAVRELQAGLANRIRLTGIGFGLLGLIGVLIGTLLGLAETVTWYLMLIIVLFGLGSLNCFAIKRSRSGISCLLYGIGFIVGFYIYGRWWGMLIGIGIAFLIGFFIIKPYKEDLEAHYMRNLQEMLAGEKKK